MLKVEIRPDCGNAPRKIFLKELYTAIANGDLNFLDKNISEDIYWEILGKKIIIGKENYLKEIKGHKLWQPKNLIIDTIITHGRDASLNGKIIGPDKLKFSFCDIYKFKGAGGKMISSILTFIIIE